MFFFVLRFLLLPAFLGDLFLKQTASDKMISLNIAKVCFNQNDSCPEWVIDQYKSEAKKKNSFYGIMITIVIMIVELCTLGAWQSGSMITFTGILAPLDLGAS